MKAAELLDLPTLQGRRPGRRPVGAQTLIGGATRPGQAKSGMCESHKSMAPASSRSNTQIRYPLDSASAAMAPTSDSHSFSSTVAIRDSALNDGASAAMAPTSDSHSLPYRKTRNTTTNRLECLATELLLLELKM